MVTCPLCHGPDPVPYPLAHFLCALERRARGDAGAYIDEAFARVELFHAQIEAFRLDPAKLKGLLQEYHALP
jgi:hypothetical protein